MNCLSVGHLLLQDKRDQRPCTTPAITYYKCYKQAGSLVPCTAPEEKTTLCLQTALQAH